MRGHVQRSEVGFFTIPVFPWIWFGHRLYCAIICSKCMQVVGYEAPSKQDIEDYQVKEHRKKQAKRESDVMVVDSHGRAQVNEVAKSSIGSSYATSSSASTMHWPPPKDNFIKRSTP
jgi:hypothetical protein